VLLGKHEKRWYGRWREDSLQNGRLLRVRRQKFLGTLRELPTKKLAQRELQEQLKTINSPTYRAQPTATFTEFVARWEATVIPQLKPSTGINYRSHLRCYLVPYFGPHQLKGIGAEIVQRFVASLSVSPKTVRNVFVTFQSLWRSARAWHYVTNDATEGIVLPQSRRVQRFFFSAEDIKRILNAAPEPYRTFYGLAAETGLRCGELCALRVDDVDFDRSLLCIRQSAWRGKIGEPKTSSGIRNIELSPQAIECLKQFLERWHPNDARLLFATRNGTAWDGNLLLKRKFRPLLKRLGIEVPRGNGFHSFRHCNETMMDRLGTPLKLRQQRLGHTDSRLTLDVYTHVASEDARRVAGQLGDAIWGVLDANGREKQKAGVSFATNSRWYN